MTGINDDPAAADRYIALHAAPSPPPVAAERLALAERLEQWSPSKGDSELFVLIGRERRMLAHALRTASLSGALEPTTDYQDGWNVGHAEGFELGLRSREAAAAEQVTAEPVAWRTKSTAKDGRDWWLTPFGEIAKGWQAEGRSVEPLYTSPAPADQAVKALEWIRDQQWNEDADLDDICTTAERAIQTIRGVK